MLKRLVVTIVLGEYAGSGKTYTMFGPAGCFSRHYIAARQRRAFSLNPSDFPDWGLLPRIVASLLERGRKERDVKFQLTVSAVEVYQNNLFDLLNFRAPVALTDNDARLMRTAAGRRKRRIADKARKSGKYHKTEGFELAGNQVQRIRRLE